METIETLNFYLALSSVAMLIIAGILLVDFYSQRALESLVRTWGLMVAFLVTLASTVMTLIYSDVFGFVPCGLCWFQRIFLYPQVFLVGTALYFKDKTAARYGIVLSVPGLLIALYQHYLQMGGTELVSCPTAGEGADCAQRFLFEFGFLTFPLLSAILFVFLSILYFYILRVRTI